MPFFVFFKKPATIDLRKICTSAYSYKFVIRRNYLPCKTHRAIRDMEIGKSAMNFELIILNKYFLFFRKPGF